jgi:polar amino acid transport system substrate-binding protein
LYWKLLALCLAFIGAQAGAQTLKACMLDEDYAPHSFPRREAPGQRLISMAVQRQGQTVEFLAAPWRRCLDGIRKGQYDLIVGPSPNPSFFEFIAYPLKDGKPDGAQSMGPVDYVVLRRKGSSMLWNGDTFTQLNSPVFYGNGAVIVRAKLDKLGVASDDSAHEIKQLVDMLYHDRTDAVVMRVFEAESLLAQSPYQGKLEILPKPLVSFNAYLGASLALRTAQPALLNAIWAEMGRIRASAEWPVISERLMRTKP